MNKPALSLILCSRNDQYMGNSRWRLETTLNYVAQKVHEIDKPGEVEILVVDWGSEIPLRDVLELSSAAEKIVSFIQIPPEIAQILQKDSPFPEVLALNAAARRASGDYIGRIDQDTLVGKRFLNKFFELYEGKQPVDVPLASALLFANQKMVPYRFCVRCPTLEAVNKYVDWFGRFFKIQLTPGKPFYDNGVGIWLLPQTLWDECGGYDQRMIYMNAMEVEMMVRLIKNHKMINLGKLVDYDFYHLEHYHPLRPRKSALYRKVNPEPAYANSEMLNPNGADWGLAKYSFEKLSYSKREKSDELVDEPGPAAGWLSFIFMTILTGTQIELDVLVKSFRPIMKSIRVVIAIWRRRVAVVRIAVHNQPVILWPRLLTSLWVAKIQRQSRGIKIIK
jgi:hypothetical protein